MGEAGVFVWEKSDVRHVVPEREREREREGETLRDVHIIAHTGMPALSTRAHTHKHARTHTTTNG